MTISRDAVIAAYRAIAVGSDVDSGQCQRAEGRAGQYMLNAVGLTAEAAAYWNNYGFGSADKAWAAAVAADRVYITDISKVGEARVGSSVHFEYVEGGKVYGHVGKVTGPDEFISISANPAGLIQRFADDVQINSISGYAKSRKFRGVATSNGNRPALEDYAQLNPQPKPNQRVVVPRGGRRRADRFDPSSEYLSVPNLPGGSIQTPTGWAHGAEVSGSTVWFLFADGRATHSSAFTDPSVHDLPDLNPVVPVIHTVKFDLGDTGFNVDVEDGKPVPEPDRLSREGYKFDGWYFGTTLWNFDAPILADITLEPHFTEIVPEIPDEPDEPDEPAGPGEPDIDEPDEPEPPVEPEPTSGQIPIVIPNIENLDDSAIILADSVSPWLSSGVRAKVYEYAQIVAAAFGSIAGIGTATVLVLGAESQIGAIAGGVAIVSTALASAAGVFGNRLARKNTPLEAAKRLAFKGEPLGVATVAKIRANNQ